MNQIDEGVILTCDIRNFTSYTYKVGCKKSIKRIENFIVQLIENAQKYHAEIINLTGDGFILVFKGDNKQDNALQTALSFRDIIKQINKKLHQNKESIIHIGIGIFEGKYTRKKLKIGEKTHKISIGHSINLSSKIESQTKKLMVDILTTKEFIDSLKNKEEYSFLKMPPMNIEGINKTYSLYWLAPQNQKRRNYE